MGTMNECVLKFTVDVVVEPDDGKFHAYAPALKGLHVGGDTEQEALENAQDAVIAYLRSLIIDGEAIPIAPIMEEINNKRRHPPQHHHQQTLALSLT